MDCDNHQPTKGGEVVRHLSELSECTCEMTGSIGSTLLEKRAKDDNNNYFIESTLFEEMNPIIEEAISIRLSLDHPYVIKTYDYTIINTPDEHGWREVQYKEEQTDCTLGRYIFSNKKLAYTKRKELILQITEGLNYLHEQNVFIHVIFYPCHLRSF